MAEEFVDLYQVLELPIEADRGTVRKRINELYMDAQRNLDHRHFATRIKFQELFEVTLPQARYILLDDGRRDQYNRLVNAFRSPGGLPVSAPPVFTEPSPTLETLPEAPAPEATSSQSMGGFSLQTAPLAAGERAPAILPLPQTAPDPAQMAQEREELWKKWKSGLEAALTVEEGDAPKARGAVTSAPTSFSMMGAPESLASQSQAATASVPPASVPPASVPPASVPPASVPEPVSAPMPTPVAKTPARPKVKISFDGEEAAAPPSPAVAAGFTSEAETALSNAEMESRRAEHRRQITKEILVNVGLIWGIAGAALVLVPGIAALIAAVAHYYPRGAPPLLGYPSVRLWGVGFVVLSAAAFFASRELSNAMRRKKATQLSLLSYEELLTQTSKS